MSIFYVFRTVSLDFMQSMNAEKLGIVYHVIYEMHLVNHTGRPFVCCCSAAAWYQLQQEHQTLQGYALTVSYLQ